MKHTYTISGMTCDSCEEKVQGLLQNVNGVTSVRVNRENGEAEVTMKDHLTISVFQNALKDYPRYELNERHLETKVAVISEEKGSWLQTYKPVLLIFAFITGTTVLIQLSSSKFNWMQWMNHFMAGFFLTFSFFKLLNLRGFAESYSTYDIIAKRWKGYGYIYAFVELGLGLAYLLDYDHELTNAITIIVMGVSMIGVLQTLLNKRRIKCACLGDVFNLPMSTITVIEDGLMIIMALIMLIYMLL